MFVEEGGSQAHTQGPAAHLGALQGTLLRGGAYAHAVRQVLADAAGEAQVGIHGRSHTVDFLLPVGVGIAQGSLGGRIETVEVADEGTDAGGVKHFVVLGDGVDGSGHVQSYVHGNAGGLGTLLGGNHDNTVGSTGTVDGGGRCILEDGEALDVFRINGGQRIAHTGNTVIGDRQAVDDVQRVVGSVDGGAATDTDGCSGAGHTGTGGNDDTRALAAEEVGRRGDDALVDFIGLDRRDGTGEVALFHGTVTDDHHLVEEIGIFFEENGSGHILGRESLGCIADAGDFHHSIGTGNSEEEVAIQTGGNAVGRSLLDHRGSDNGADGIYHHTFNLVSALGEYGHAVSAQHCKCG